MFVYLTCCVENLKCRAAQRAFFRFFSLVERLGRFGFSSCRKETHRPAKWQWPTFRTHAKLKLFVSNVRTAVLAYGCCTYSRVRTLHFAHRSAVWGCFLLFARTINRSTRLYCLWAEDNFSPTMVSQSASVMADKEPTCVVRAVRMQHTPLFTRIYTHRTLVLPSFHVSQTERSCDVVLDLHFGTCT